MGLSGAAGPKALILLRELRYVDEVPFGWSGILSASLKRREGSFLPSLVPLQTSIGHASKLMPNRVDPGAIDACQSARARRARFTISQTPRVATSVTNRS